LETLLHLFQRLGNATAEAVVGFLFSQAPSTEPEEEQEQSGENENGPAVGSAEVKEEHDSAPSILDNISQDISESMDELGKDHGPSKGDDFSLIPNDSGIRH
jgi:hypothetical protein